MLAPTPGSAPAARLLRGPSLCLQAVQESRGPAPGETQHPQRGPGTPPRGLSSWPGLHTRSPWPLCSSPCCPPSPRLSTSCSTHPTRCKARRGGWVALLGCTVQRRAAARLRAKMRAARGVTHATMRDAQGITHAKTYAVRGIMHATMCTAHGIMHAEMRAAHRACDTRGTRGHARQDACCMQGLLATLHV